MRSSRLAAVAATFVLALTLGGCATTPSASSTSGSETSPSAATTCAYQASTSPAAKTVTAPPTTPAVTGEVSVTIATSAGDLNLTLDADKAPCAVNNFVSLAEQGYFDGTSCHRLTTSGIYVLQCGDPSGTGAGGPGYSFADELDPNESYPAGTVAMANAGPNTNGSQFFLVYQDAPGALAPAYTPFGTFDEASVTIVQEIAKAGLADDRVAPQTPVDISSVSVTP